MRAASLYTDVKKSKKIRPPGAFFIHRLPKNQKNPPSGRLLYTQTSKKSKKTALLAASLYTDFQKSKKIRPPGGFFIRRLPKIKKNPPSGRLPRRLQDAKKIRGFFVHRRQKIKKKNRKTTDIRDSSLTDIRDSSLTDIRDSSLTDIRDSSLTDIRDSSF
jgi:hypothetical protein